MNKEPVVYKPKMGETMKEYLQRYTDDEKLKIFEDPDKRIDFCTILVETPWAAKRSKERLDSAYEKLCAIIQDTENYNVLLHHIKMWEPSRREVLINLSECADELKKVSKVSTVGRIIGCTVESLGTIFGLKFAASEGANWFLHMATLFGGLGIFITLVEMKIAKNTYYNLVELIKRDQKEFRPIQVWYQQSEKIENAMKNVFPFDFTRKIVEEFTDIVAGKKEFDPVRFLSRIIAELAEKNKENVQDRNLLENLIDFISSSRFKDFCEWIFFKETHPAALEIIKMVLQYYYSPFRFIVCQKVGALAPANQNLYSIPVMGRLILNGFSLVNEISRLNSFEVPGIYEMRKLENHLRLELEALNRIAKLFGKMDLEF